MKIINSTFFETLVNYKFIDDTAASKQVSEAYVTTAETFTEAEIKICNYFTDGQVVNIKKLVIAPYREVIRPDDTPEESHFFKATIRLVATNERTGKDVFTKIPHLVEAANIDKARDYIKAAYDKNALDYEIISLVETKIIEII